MKVMAKIVRRNNLAQVMAMSPKDIGESDDSNSPHLTTMKIAIEKAKKSELPKDDNIKIDGSASTNSPQPQTHHVDRNNHENMIGADIDEYYKLEEAPSGTLTSNTSSPSYIPAHLCESSEPSNRPRSHQDEGNEAKPPPPPPSGRSHENEDDVKKLIDKVEDGTAIDTPSSDQPVTPTMNIHRQVPSSSIPHLLSASNSFSREAANAMQQQLSFVGIDAALSPTVRSRNGSFAFSVDGDDAAFVREGTTRCSTASPQVIPADASSFAIGSCLSNLSSSVSLASSYGASPNKITPEVSDIPPLPPSSFTSPPLSCKLPVCTNIQGMNMPQLPHNTNREAEKGDQTSTILSSGRCGLPQPSQPLPPSYQQSNRYPLNSSGTQQPVALYSAINSLERYNAGSFDNKVMLAKARGTYGKQKAFPGVPQNNSKEGLDGSMRSELESTNSSGIVSGVSSIDEKGTRMQQQQNSVMVDQTGIEQSVPTRSEQSQTTLLKSRKSRSSGNLSELDDPKATRKENRSVTIKEDQQHKSTSSRRGRRREKKAVGVFRPSSDAYTPRMGHRDLKYKPAKERECVEKISSTMGTIQRPNFRDALRRVAIILHQHIVKIEHRFSTGNRGVDDTGLFKASMRDEFHEDNFATPRYKCAMVRVPMARPGVVYSMRKIRVVHTTPTTDEIYEFAHQLFKKVQLSSECSIVCLIYVEKLMEVAKVPLVAETWRPIFMAGLLLASKVWQDLSSWNIEFASVYPQFSLDAINRLELLFLKFIKWDLYISSSLYAKYYFALRSLLEKSGFRNRYNEMIGGIGGVAASEAMKVSKRSEALKEESLLQLSRSM